MVRAYILHKPLASTSHHVSVNFAIVWIRYRTKLAMEHHLKLKTPHGCHQIISVFELGVFQTMYFLVLLNCFSLHFCLDYLYYLVLSCTQPIPRKMIGKLDSLEALKTTGNHQQLSGLKNRLQPVYFD
jgi:hypothetical protein